jgi:hypothetical protein
VTEPDPSTRPPEGGAGTAGAEARRPSRRTALLPAALAAVAIAALAAIVVFASRGGTPTPGAGAQTGSGRSDTGAAPGGTEVRADSGALQDSPETSGTPGDSRDADGPPDVRETADAPADVQETEQVRFFNEMAVLAREACSPAPPAPPGAGGSGAARGTSPAQPGGRASAQGDDQLSAQADSRDYGDLVHQYNPPDIPPFFIKIWQSNYKLVKSGSENLFCYEFTLDTRGSSVGKLDDIKIRTDHGYALIDGVMNDSEEEGFKTAWLATYENNIEYFVIESVNATWRNLPDKDVSEYLFMKEDIQPRPLLTPTDSPDIINAIKKFEIPKLLINGLVEFGALGKSLDLPRTYFSDFVDAAVEYYDQQNINLMMFHGARLVDRPVNGPYISLFFNEEGVVGFSVMHPRGPTIDTDTSSFTFSCKIVVDEREVVVGAVPDTDDDDADDVADADDDGADEGEVVIRRYVSCIEPSVEVPRAEAERIGLVLAPLKAGEPERLISLELGLALRSQQIMAIGLRRSFSQ